MTPHADAALAGAARATADSVERTAARLRQTAETERERTLAQILDMHVKALREAIAVCVPDCAKKGAA